MKTRNHYPQIADNKNTLMKRGVALGTAVLAVSLGVGCSTKAETPPPQPYVRSAETLEDAKMIATAYDCSINKDTLYAVPPRVEPDRHIFFQGVLQVDLNLKRSEEAKQTMEQYKNKTWQYPVTWPGDPLVSVKPRDFVWEPNAAIDTETGYANQKFTANPDGTATLNGSIPYLPNKDGKFTDIPISLVQEVLTEDDTNMYKTRGTVYCGSLHFDDKKGWQLVEEKVAPADKAKTTDEILAIPRKAPQVVTGPAKPGK